MDGQALERWFDSQQRGDFGALPAHSDVLYDFFLGLTSASETARALVEDVSDKPSIPDSDRPWRAWQLIYVAATELPRYHDALVDLVYEVQRTASLDPNEGTTTNSSMLDAWPYWRDHFDGLKTHSHLRQKADFDPVIPLSGHEKLIHYGEFSAKLVGRSPAFVQAIGAFGFFELRNILESTDERYREGLLIDREVTAISEARSADLQAACLWILMGGINFRALDNSSLEGFENGYSQNTEFWTGAPGVSEERWRLWRDRLREISAESGLSESAKDAARRAAEAIDGND